MLDYCSDVLASRPCSFMYMRPKANEVQAVEAADDSYTAGVVSAQHMTLNGKKGSESSAQDLQFQCTSGDDEYASLAHPGLEDNDYYGVLGESCRGPHGNRCKARSQMFAESDIYEESTDEAYIVMSSQSGGAGDISASNMNLCSTDSHPTLLPVGNVISELSHADGDEDDDCVYEDMSCQLKPAQSPVSITSSPLSVGDKDTSSVQNNGMLTTLPPSNSVENCSPNAEDDIYSGLYMDMSTCKLPVRATTSEASSLVDKPGCISVGRSPSMPTLSPLSEKETADTCSRPLLSHPAIGLADSDPTLSVKDSRARGQDFRIFSRMWLRKPRPKTVADFDSSSYKNTPISSLESEHSLSDSDNKVFAASSTESISILQRPFEVLEDSRDDNLPQVLLSGMDSSPGGKRVLVKTSPDELVTATGIDLVQAAHHGASVLVEAKCRSNSFSSGRGERRRRGFLRGRRSAGEEERDVSPCKSWHAARPKPVLDRRLSAQECDECDALSYHSYLQDAFFPNSDQWQEDSNYDV